MYCDGCNVILSVYRLSEWPESKGIFVSVCALFYQKRHFAATRTSYISKCSLFCIFLYVIICAAHTDIDAQKRGLESV